MYTLWCICIERHAEFVKRIAQKHRLDPIQIDEGRAPDWSKPFGDILLGLRRSDIASGNFGFHFTPESLQQIQNRLMKKHRNWSQTKLDRAAQEKFQSQQKHQPLPFLPGYYPELEVSRKFITTVCEECEITLIMEYLDEPWEDASKLPRQHWKFSKEVTLEALYYFPTHTFVTIGS